MGTMSDQINLTVMMDNNETNSGSRNDTNSSNTSDSEEESCSGVIEWGIFIAAIIVGVIIFLFILRKIIQGPFYRKKNRIDGKVVIITGCNTGIGKETALEMAHRGGKIYMACRDPVRCEGARLEIIEKTKNENVYNRTLDLASLESIRKFAEKFVTEESRLDILINNAGIMATPKGLTKDGYEQQFGVNHLGHFLLTNLLLDLLKSSAPSRIIVVTSAIYIFGRIKKNDLMREKSYTRFGAYSQSKLANILFTKKLAEKLHGTNVTVNCCHPGIVKTELSRHIIGGKLKSFLDIFMRYVMKSPVAGAQTTLRLALDPCLEKSSGGYYFDTIRCPVLPKASNGDMADWLWQVSEEMLNLRPKTQQLTIVPTVASDIPITPAANGNGIKIQQTMPDSRGDNATVINVEQTPDIVELIDEEMKNKMIMSETTITVGNDGGQEEGASDEPEKMDEPEKKLEIDLRHDIIMTPPPTPLKMEAVMENNTEEEPQQIATETTTNVTSPSTSGNLETDSSKATLSENTKEKSM